MSGQRLYDNLEFFSLEEKLGKGLRKEVCGDGTMYILDLTDPFVVACVTSRGVVVRAGDLVRLQRRLPNNDWAIEEVRIADFRYNPSTGEIDFSGPSASIFHLAHIEYNVSSIVREDKNKRLAART